MCGIAGPFYAARNRTVGDNRLETARGLLSHRGPDTDNPGWSPP